MVDALNGRAGNDRDEVRALLALDQMPGIGLATLRRLVRIFGSATGALEAPAAAFTDLVGPDAERARGDARIGREVDAALAESDRLGMETCTWESADYPSALLHLHDPPPVLFLRGRRELLGRACVTIVGARRATARARGIGERLGAGLGAAGVCVVSGMALGVDGAAHRGALDAEGDTIAVLGRGADAPYPLSHTRLYRRILQLGLVVSEFLPGTPPLPHHFPRRNRILAGLARAVVVVEAGAKSGSLITVDHALDLGIDVWAVPGPIETPTCTGSNRLLADGARPLLSVADFVRALGGTGERPADPEALPAGTAGRLLTALGAETLTADELGPKAGLSAAETLAWLADLELRGMVSQVPGMRFRRVA